MHLLFISSNRIGDSLINLQVLNKYIRKNKKDIEITLVSGELPLPIYDDYNMITNRIILKKEKYNLHWWKLYKKLSPLKFDEIVANAQNEKNISPELLKQLAKILLENGMNTGNPEGTPACFLCKGGNTPRSTASGPMLRSGAGPGGRFVRRHPHGGSLKGSQTKGQLTSTRSICLQPQVHRCPPIPVPHTLWCMQDLVWWQLRGSGHNHSFLCLCPCRFRLREC